jgi:glycerate dehydrogenase
MKIVVLDGYTLNPGDNPWDPLAALGELTVYDRTNPEDVLERSRGAEILITNKTRLNADTLAALPDLRCIGVIATGYDVVDIAAAGKRGIPVMNVVNYGTEAVAQHAFALLLELCRRTALHDAGIRSGRWAAGPDWCFWDTPQVELSGKVMGILGFGTIGRRVAELAHAFGMKVIAASVRKSAAEMSASSAPVSFPVEFVEMDELFRASDVLSLHCPLTEQTRAIVNAANIASMKDGAILLNLARGPLLDEAAVAEALASGKLGGLGADVVVEAAGTAESFNAASEIIKHNGKFVFYSWVTTPVTLNISRWHDDGLEFINTCLVHHTWQQRYVWCPEALRPVAQGLVEVRPLITDEFRLDDIKAGFDLADKDDAAIKIVFRP